MTSGKPRLAILVALAYTLVIVYASLQPFAGWRMPPQDILGFLGAPWPRYVTARDVTLNVVAYLPFGAMLFAALRPPLPASAAFVAATFIAALLSLALESAQMFLPARIASNLDLLSNSGGAGIGALAACVLSLPALQDNSLAALRRRAVRTDTLGDCGLIVVALWILIQFHQAPLALGSGDLREALRITPFFSHTPRSYLLAETGVVALAVVAIGLIVSLLQQPQQPQRPMLPAIALTLALALAAKSIVAVSLTRSAHWLQWLTPGVLAGIAGSAVLLALLLRLAREARGAVAALCIMAVVIIVNIAPENPYQAVPTFMLRPQPTHLLNFSHIVRTLSQLWPLAAVIFLLVLARAERAGTRLNNFGKPGNRR
ncbi:MAG: VanZ family protein [Betaproteobacteria bacterium]|nr:VanZ family protein [Betaproteobacteria bacterium]